jgi:hypothetical protein
MRKAEYRIAIENEQNAEAILEEIDNYFIELEHKYTSVQVET